MDNRLFQIIGSYFPNINLKDILVITKYISSPKYLKKGENLAKVGDYNKKLFLVLSGQIGCYLDNDEIKMQLIYLVVRGELTWQPCGFLVQKKERNITLQAIKRTTYLEINYEKYLLDLKQYPERFYIMGLLVDRIAEWEYKCTQSFKESDLNKRLEQSKEIIKTDFDDDVSIAMQSSFLRSTKRALFYLKNKKK